MLENSVVQMTTAKLIGATVLPNSILLISGIVIWRFWLNKQTKLQAETDELTDEVKQMQEQITDIRTAQIANNTSLPNKESPSTLVEKINEKTDHKNKNTGLFEFLIEDNVRLRKQA